MALKDKFTGKRERGLIVNARRELHQSQSAGGPGTYIALIGNSLTPIIGTASSTTGLTVSGGYLNVAANGTGRINLSAAPTINMTTDSAIFAVEASFLAGASTEFSIDANGFASNRQTVKLGGDHGAPGNIAAYQNYDALELSSLTIPAGQSVYLMLAYDGASDTLSEYIRIGSTTTFVGSITSPGFPTPPVSETISRFSFVELGGAAGFGVRNVHAIKFSNRGLPSDVSGLFAAYIASPSTQLNLAGL